jgi:hypothetical protein
MHCRSLLPSRLVALKLAYLYMPGFSTHIRAPALYDLPFVPATWFGNTFDCLEILDLFCVPLCWSLPGLFDRLQVVDLSDFSCYEPLDPHLLTALFLTAVNMRSLRLGPLRLFEVPSDYVLRSASLQILDLEFFRPRFVGRLLEAIRAPNLSDLVVRGVYDQLHLLLICPDLLLGITTFTVHLEIGDSVSLQHLYSAMPSLHTLDLTYSCPHVFDTYCAWAYSRVQFGLPNCAAQLKVMHLPPVSVLALVDLVKFVAVHSLTPQGIRRVRLEGYTTAGNVPGLSSLSLLVSDFALTNYYTPYREAYDITGLSRHSFIPRYIQNV